MDRRQWLQLCGGVAVVGLAGCVGGDDNDDNGNDDNGNGTSNANGTDEEVTVDTDTDQRLLFNGERSPVTQTYAILPTEGIRFHIDGVLEDDGPQYRLTVAFPRDEDDVVDVSNPIGGQLRVWTDPENIYGELYRDTDNNDQPLVDMSEWDLTFDFSGRDSSLHGTLFLPPVPVESTPRLPSETFPEGVDIELDVTAWLPRPLG